jgi:hypothetical protein
VPAFDVVPVTRLAFWATAVFRGSAWCCYRTILTLHAKRVVLRLACDVVMYYEAFAPVVEVDAVRQECGNASDSVMCDLGICSI